MTHIVETESGHHSILIVDKTRWGIAQTLKKSLSKFDNEVFVSSMMPQKLDRFSVCIFINESPDIVESLYPLKSKKIAFLFVNQQKHAAVLLKKITSRKTDHIKIITLQSYYVRSHDIEKILWFSLTQSTEPILNIYNLPPPDHVVRAEKAKRQWSLKFSRKLSIILVVIVLLFGHLAFIPPLVLSGYYIYKGVTYLQEEKMDELEKILPSVDRYISVTDNLYKIARPTLLFFTLAPVPENYIQLNKTAYSLLKRSISMRSVGQEFAELFFGKSRSNFDTKRASHLLAQLHSDLKSMTAEVSSIYQKFPTWNERLVKKRETLKIILDHAELAQKVFPHLSKLLGSEGERTYLLLFANNKELRPGGGFIGSFGVLKVKNYAFESMQVYDVYDADGQLTTHVPPPLPIRTYLNQPHWFLRDSAFSADFQTNYLSAVKFLDQEMGFKDFDGGLLITTTAIQHVLEAIGPLYLADYKEIITKDNFYLKAQLYAEKGFFPGSTQKKTFLAQIWSELLLKLELNPTPKLAQAFIQSFNEKQMVAFFEDQQLQKLIETLYWSGGIISPGCTSANARCILDYLYPVEANLGVNKANFFVNRHTSLQVKIDRDGIIKNRYRIQLTNDSPNDVFPGGTYKNYQQIIVPAASTVTAVTTNDVAVDDYEEEVADYRTIGFYLEIPPGKSVDIIVEYEHELIVEKGNTIYQLIVQKQTGSSNFDFDLSVSLPKNIFLLNQNFTPLVKGSTIIYNTTIKADKIFFIELLRE